MKKWLSILLVSVMLMSAIAMTAFAEQLTEEVSGSCGYKVAWTLTTDGVLTIRGKGKMDGSSWNLYNDQIISVVIEHGVTSIVQNAFRDCIKLTSITIPDSVTSIGDRAFSGCNALREIAIPGSVTHIGQRAFGMYLEITVSEDNEEYCSVDGVLFNKAQTELIHYPVGRVQGLGSSYTYEIPKTVTKIADYAFFNGSDNAKVKSVKIVIPDSVEHIGDFAFYNLPLQEMIEIPSSVTYIGKAAFKFCFSLKTVYYCGTEAQWKRIVLGEDNDHLLNAKIVYGVSGEKSDKTGNPFTDVPADAYYADAVKWAYENGITTGTSATTFGPMDTCTRGQVVTFLWRAKGCPEPTSTVNPFTDVKETDYFYKAVLWAVENGITNGMTETTFGPKETCTSGHVVTFLWRANGQPAAVGESTLVESGKWYSNAVAWADSVGLLSGTGIAFAVGNNAPRADIVTYLYRDIVA